MNDGKNAKKGLGGISGQFLKISYLPMILITLIITIAGSSFVLSSLKQGAKSAMEDTANMVLMNLDDMYPGDFNSIQLNEAIYLLKGEHQFNGDFEYVDKVKEKTGYDVTICYMNYAVATTLTDNSGTRLVGAADSDVVYNDVIVEGNVNFYPEVDFNKQDYMAYYTPFRNADGDVVGMLCIASATDSLKTLVWQAIVPLICIAVIAMLIACIFTYRYSKKFIDAISRIQKYMKKVSDGDFLSDIDYAVESRNDEIGQMGFDAQKTARILRKLVEEDQLTQLNNRRSADKKIKATISNYIEKGVDFCVALGDIDFFKEVNDTYGHEAGDKVLMAVADTLKNFMADKGYAIRWGGEEFLLIFDKGKVELESCARSIEGMLDQIRALEIVSGDQIIKVNMTFGLLECEKDDIEAFENFTEEHEESKDVYLKSRMDYYISEADKRLYYGKERGRNQLVAYAVPKQ